MAEVDMFLKIDNLEGESKDSKYEKWIDISSFHCASTNSGTMSRGGGGGAGVVSFSDASMTMKTCKCTPKLMLANANGEHFKKATVIFRKAGKQQQEYQKYEFTDVMVTSYSQGGGGVEQDDSISLGFSAIKYEYKPQKPDGTLDGAINFHWDVKQKKGG